MKKTGAPQAPEGQRRQQLKRELDSLAVELDEKGKSGYITAMQVKNTLAEVLYVLQKGL